MTKKWDGRCPTGLHGLDFEGQPCGPCTWQPITIGQHGERLLAYSADNPPADDDEVNTCCGRHEYCGGWIDVHRVSSTHRSLSCRHCGLYVAFPKAVETFGDLRRHFAVLQR